MSVLRRALRAVVGSPFVFFPVPPSERLPIAGSDRIRAFAVALAGALAVLPGLVQGQPQETSIYDEQGKLLRGSETVAALGPDLFGDQVSLYTGTLEFVQTDVSLPGNSALPVSVGRRFVVGANGWMQGHFGDWDLDVPHVHGVFAADFGWAVAGGGGRCSNFGRPPTATVGIPAPQNGSYTVDGEAYWQGNYVYVPGRGDQEILTRATANAPPTNVNSASYTLTTKDGGMIRCISSGSGEGFELLTPDGTTYRFDHLIQHSIPSMAGGAGGISRGAGEQESGPLPTRGNNGKLNRVEVWIVPTLVTDRYGNTVTYSWSGRQLTAITGSDGGRSLSITYYLGTNLVHTVTATVGGSEPARVWTYLYQNGLKYVRLPNGSQWDFDLYDLYLQYPMANVEGSQCDDTSIAIKGPYTGTLTHPNGAKGTFTVGTEEHGRTWVERHCINVQWVGPPGSGHWDYTGSWSRQPKHFANLALKTKTLTGTGIPAPGYQWIYDYNDNVSMSDYCWDPASTSLPTLDPGNYRFCTASSPTTKMMRVTEKTPGRDDVVTRYTFGIKARVNEGQLLKTEFGWDGSTAKRTVETTYHSYTSLGGVGGGTAPPWPTPIGSSIVFRGDKHMAERLYPEKKRLTLQDGAGLTWEAQAFDHRARPTQVLRARVGSLGSSRTETTTYHDNTSKWVLGQVGTVTQRNNSGTLVLTPVANTYDSATANLLTHTKYGALHRSYQWHADGTLWNSTDGRGKVTTYVLYKRGIPQWITYQNGDVVRAVVNDTGEITAVTQAGFQRQYKYDLVGRLERITYPAADETIWSTTNLAYEQVFSSVMGGTHLKQTVTTEQAAGKVATRIVYLDALLRPALTEEFDSSQKAVTLRSVATQFDAQGRSIYASYPQRTQITSIHFTAPNGVNPYPPGTTTHYDSVGRVAQTLADVEAIPGVTDTQAKTVISYDVSGKKVVDPRGYWTKTFFQLFDEPSEDAPIQVEDAVGITSITRDAFSRPTAMARGSHVRQYFYDANNRLCKTIEPETNVTIIDYDAAGNTAWKAIGLVGSNFDTASNAANCQRANVDTYAWSTKTLMTYDDRNRLETTLPRDGSPRIVRTWTPDNLPATVKTERQPGDVTSLPTEWDYFYDKRRLLRRERLTAGADLFTVFYGYDAAGNRSQMTYPDNTTVAYDPNALGQPQKVGAYASEGRYHANGGLWQFKYGNNLWHYTYQNKRGLPDQAQDGAWLSDLYTYDLNGNVSKVSDQVNGQGTRRMEYDSRNRLTKVRYWGEQGLAESTGEYDYDALDNPIKNKTYVSSTPLTPNRNFQYTYELGTSRLLQIYDPIWSSVQSYTYLDNGRTRTRSAPFPLSISHQYSYDLLDRLNQVTPIGASSPILAQYDYDGHGRRVRISENGQTPRMQVYTQSGQLIYEKAGINVTKYLYLGRHLLAKVANSTVKYQHTDGLGTPVLETDVNGSLIPANASRRQHEAYGEPIGKVFVNGPDFTGHVMDSQTRLIYMQARYYDPVQGRFLTPDPVEASAGSFNRYWYANNNPYTNIDPDGREGAAATAYATGQCSHCLGNGPAPRGTGYVLAAAGAVTTGGLFAAPVVAAALLNPAAANSLVITAMEIGAGDALGGASLAVGAVAVKSLGPFHRLGDAPEAIQSIRASGELRGNPPANFFQSDIPKVQAYDGPLPDGARGFEFTTPIAPDVGHVPGKPTWNPSSPGVAERDGQAVIACTVTRSNC